MARYEAVVTYVHPELEQVVGSVGDVIEVGYRDGYGTIVYTVCDSEWAGRLNPCPDPDYSRYNFCIDLLTGEELE